MEDETIYTIGEVLIAIGLLVSLSSALAQVKNTTLFEKNYFARDTALLATAVYGSPANIFYHYRTKDYEFNFDILHSITSVASKDRTKPVYYTFAEDKAVESSTWRSQKPPKTIIFEKSGDKFTVGDQLKTNLNKLNCPALRPTGALSAQNLLIDPGHGDGTEIAANGLNESEINLDMAIPFFIRAENNFNGIESTRIGDLRARLGRLSSYSDKTENADIIISIHAGNYQDKNKNYIKAYYSFNSEKSEEAKALACAIINKILDNLDINKTKFKDIAVAVVPVGKEQNDEKQILNNNKVSILLEIGNIQIDKNANMLGDIGIKNAIGKSIYEALEGYYKNG